MTCPAPFCFRSLFGRKDKPNLPVASFPLMKSVSQSVCSNLKRNPYTESFWRHAIWLIHTFYCLLLICWNIWTFMQPTRGHLCLRQGVACVFHWADERQGRRERPNTFLYLEMPTLSWSRAFFMISVMAAIHLGLSAFSRRCCFAINNRWHRSFVRPFSFYEFVWRL